MDRHQFKGSGACYCQIEIRVTEAGGYSWQIDSIRGLQDRRDTRQRKT
jgi:hypothetical protein